MSISPLAVRAFLNQRRDDFSYLKTISSKELRAMLVEVDPRIEPYLKDMMQHQLAGIFLGLAFPAFAFWYGMGIGKTIMVLRLLAYWYDTGQLRKALTLVPSNETVYTWGDEIRKWGVKIPYAELADDTSDDKAEKMLTMSEGLVIASYPGFRYMVSEEKDEVKKGEKTGRRRRRANALSLDVVADGLDGFVMDESTEAAHRDSLTFAICNGLSKRTSIRYALAGRPFGRDPTLLWAQQFLVDRGESLGPTLGLFREAFFSKKKSFFGGPYSFDYKFKKESGPALAKCSAHRSMQYATEECVDLPPKVHIVKRIPFPPETIEYYNRVLEHMMSARGDKQVIRNDFIRLRQLSSGFLGVANDEFGAKVEIEFKKNPKLDMLVEYLNQIPVGKKAVIFYEFVHSGRLISAALKKLKIKHSWVWSGAKNRKQQMDRFRDDPECEVLILNHQIGAYGLNLQHAKYVLVYESPVGCIDRDQMDRRSWRTGQTERVTIVDLCMIGGADEKILQFHAEGADIYSAVHRNPVGFFRRHKAA